MINDFNDYYLQAIGPKTNGGGFSLKKSASSVSLKDSAGDVLKDLENGLVKSSHYIKVCLKNSACCFVYFYGCFKMIQIVFNYYRIEFKQDYKIIFLRSLMEKL